LRPLIFKCDFMYPCLQALACRRDQVMRKGSYERVIMEEPKTIGFLKTETGCC
jgi:hypothetical protein